MKTSLLFVVVASLAACSTQGAFDSIQAGNRNHCSKLPPVQYESCIESVSKSYKEYQIEREEALKKRI